MSVSSTEQEIVELSDDWFFSNETPNPVHMTLNRPVKIAEHEQNIIYEQIEGVQ